MGGATRAATTAPGGATAATRAAIGQEKDFTSYSAEHVYGNDLRHAHRPASRGTYQDIQAGMVKSGLVKPGPGVGLSPLLQLYLRSTNVVKLTEKSAPKIRDFGGSTSDAKKKDLGGKYEDFGMSDAGAGAKTSVSDLYVDTMKKKGRMNPYAGACLCVCVCARARTHAYVCV